MRWLCCRVLLAMVLTNLIAGPASGEGRDPNIKSLKDLESVHVLVEKLNERALAAGLRADQLRTDVELRLRMAGLKVLTREEHFDAPGMPVLLVTVTVVGSRPSSYSIDLELSQWAQLTRAPISVSAITWNLGGVGRGDAQSVRGLLRDLVDRFLNDWLSVNGK